MLPLDDPRWDTLVGGYRVRYSPTHILRELIEGRPSDSHWDALWQELHHQGNVDSASYAAVPYLAEHMRRAPKLDFNPIAIIAVIEIARPSDGNPPVPDFLSESYHSTIASLPALLGQHPDTRWHANVLAAAMSCIALARGHRGMARVYLDLEPTVVRRWASFELGLSESIPEERQELDEFLSPD